MTAITRASKISVVALLVCIATLPGVTSFGCCRHGTILPTAIVARNADSRMSSSLSSPPLRPASSSSSSRLMSSSSPSPPPDATPLCELQTLLRLCELVQSGGEAKAAIQRGDCMLNGEVETRRAKKLFPGDEVSFRKGIFAVPLNVAAECTKRGYVYKVKTKKVKPVARVDADGNLEFGGRYRSEEWRADRKQKKTKKKVERKDEKKTS